MAHSTPSRRPHASRVIQSLCALCAQSKEVYHARCGELEKARRDNISARELEKVRCALSCSLFCVRGLSSVGSSDPLPLLCDSDCECECADVVP